MTLTDHMIAAEDGLLTALQAQSDLAGVSVRLGDPGDTPPPEVVWISEDLEITWTPAVTSAPSMEETTDALTVNVLVVQSGNDYTAVRNRAAALAAGVEKAVAGAPNLGGAVMDAYVKSVKRGTGATATGRGVVLEVRVHFLAWVA